MAQREQKGMAQTVLGTVDPGELGPTSTHEHFLLDFAMIAFRPPAEASERFRAYEPVSMKNLGWVNYDPFRSRDNLVTMDEEVSIEEGLLFKKAGGRTIVDTTSRGIGRDPAALTRIARATGLNVIMGSGYYIAPVHPDDMDRRTERQIADEIVADITKGADDSGVRSGIIGELGCSWPLTDNERKVLRAGAAAQIETGASITIHPGRNPAAPFEVLDILEDAGADLTRVIIDHLDRTIHETAALERLAQRGCNLEWDFFGWEISEFSMSEMDMLNDGQRLNFIKHLADRGHIRQIVMAQDMFGKHRLTRYGGHGFDHIMRRIRPRLREKLGSTEAADTILVENPARLLTFV